MIILLFLSCIPDYKESEVREEEKPLGDPATVALGGSCPLSERWGGFSVGVNEGYSTVGGAVANGVLPASILTEVAVEGGCRLLRRENPFCEPACEAGEACDFDGSCVAYPENQDLGTVRILGMVEPVEMEPVAGNSYFDSELPTVVVLPDTLVQLQAEAFTLHGVGSEPLVLDQAAWSIGGGALPLSWQPPTGLGRSEIFLRLTVDQHGITPLSLECALPDSGSAEISGELIDTLLLAGVSGYPNGVISRRTVDRTSMGAGCVDFSVAYDVVLDLTVEGHVPCDSHDDCPFGSRCNFALETCE